MSADLTPAEIKALARILYPVHQRLARKVMTDPTEPDITDEEPDEDECPGAP